MAFQILVLVVLFVMLGLAPKQTFMFLLALLAVGCILFLIQLIVLVFGGALMLGFFGFVGVLHWLFG